MRTDPRKACANAEEKLLWAWIHDFIAHPLMALFGWHDATLKFHDWTSHKAWPRSGEQKLMDVIVASPYLMRHVHFIERSPGFWTAKTAHRSFSFQAEDLGEAFIMAENEWRTQDKFVANKERE
jgi:hypothetical protein